jgi:CxxC motif-containing protein (DUF1111 family)
MRNPLAALALVAAALAGPAPAQQTPVRSFPAESLGGPATVRESGPNAFSLPIPGLPAEDRRAFSVGNSLFRDNWVIAPASAEGRDGLGPLFNANSCSACHQEDGRGRPPASARDVGLGMVVFVSPLDADGKDHPTYGKQLQDQAIPGTRPEVAIELSEARTRGTHADGREWELVRLRPMLSEPAYGPIGDVRLSVRIGPQLIGGGLLEAVPDEAILASEDPTDRDGDGISGRAHRNLLENLPHYTIIVLVLAVVVNANELHKYIYIYIYNRN